VNTDVPVGPGSIVGFGVGATAFAAAVAAFLFGDHSEQTVGTIVGGLLSGVLFAATILGRQWQAVHKTKLEAAVLVASAATVATPKSAPSYRPQQSRPAGLEVGEPWDPSAEVAGGSVPTGTGPRSVDVTSERERL
jgi:hypothetical protein